MVVLEAHVRCRVVAVAGDCPTQHIAGPSKALGWWGCSETCLHEWVAFEISHQRPDVERLDHSIRSKHDNPKPTARRLLKKGHNVIR
jgi:hypothetical protein